jgi:hypothetical protein
MNIHISGFYGDTVVKRNPFGFFLGSLVLGLFLLTLSQRKEGKGNKECFHILITISIKHYSNWIANLKAQDSMIINIK